MVLLGHEAGIVLFKSLQLLEGGSENGGVGLGKDELSLSRNY